MTTILLLIMHYVVQTAVWQPCSIQLEQQTLQEAEYPKLITNQSQQDEIISAVLLDTILSRFNALKQEASITVIYSNQQDTSLPWAAAKLTDDLLLLAIWREEENLIVGRYYLYCQESNELFYFPKINVRWNQIVVFNHDFWINASNDRGNSVVCQMKASPPFDFKTVRYTVWVENRHAEVIFNEIQSMDSKKIAQVTLLFPRETNRDPLHGIAIYSVQDNIWKLAGYFLLP